MSFEEKIEQKMESASINEIYEKGELSVKMAKLISEIHLSNPQRSQLSPEQAENKIFEHKNGLIALSASNEDGDIIGFVYGYEMQQDDISKSDHKELKEILEGKKMNMIYLSDFGVKESERGKGLGKKMMDAFIDKAKGRGAGIIVLSAHENNKNFPASAYTKFGFKDSGIQRTGREGTIDSDYKYMILEL